MRIDCGRIPELIHPDEIKDINHVITDPDALEEPRYLDAGHAIASVEIGGSPEMEISRDEDYHEVAQEGLLEGLVELVLPQACEKNNDALWLAAVIMTRIASSQAFYEGNKRTAYVMGVLFFVKSQFLAGREEAVYPLLDMDLTDKLADAAVHDIDAEDLHDYLAVRLSEDIAD